MKNLKNLSSERLITETKNLCAEERRITAEVLTYFAEIESRRAYAELGYSSLFEFAVEELKYSEGAAGRRIAAMRVMRQIPEVEEHVRTGTLNVTVVSMAKHATRGRSIQETKQVLAQLEDQSQKKAERILAELYPDTAHPREKERMISENQTQISFTADAALMEKLEKLKNLFSHKNPNPSYQELFHLMADQLLKRLDPGKQTSSVTPVAEFKRETESRVPTLQMRRELWKRDQSSCNYVDPKTGRRCGSRHLLQVDHIQPFSLGGKTELSNLRLLCRAHNLYLAEQMGLGIGRK